jgi:hypothetical protein
VTRAVRARASGGLTRQWLEAIDRDCMTLWPLTAADGAAIPSGAGCRRLDLHSLRRHTVR